MTLALTKIFRPWILIALVGTALLGWADVRRLQRVDYVSSLAQEAAATPAGRRTLIVPERAEPTYHWLAQTNQMLASREWRVRHVDYDNAPYGREVLATSPYRWWLGLLATGNQAGTGRPLAVAVEWAARHADVLLQLLALWAATAVTAWCFGSFAAVVCVLGFVTLYPFAAGFVPGVTDHHALACVLALGSMLTVVVAFRRSKHATTWLAVSAIFGALALWVDVPTAVPVLIGIAVGGVAAAPIGRGAGTEDDGGTAWRVWGLTGAVSVLLAYGLEYAPLALGGWHLETIHPVYGVAWMGLAELVALARSWFRGGFHGAKARTAIRVLLALAAVAAVPLVLRWAGGRGFLATDVLSVRLANVPGAQAAESLAALCKRTGVGAQVTAVLLPVLAAVPAIWMLFSSSVAGPVRQSIAFALGPVLVLLAFASRELALFRVYDAALLTLVVAAAIAPTNALLRVAWALGLAALAIPGLFQLMPAKFAGDQTVLTRMEAEELIERDLARWMTRHAGEGRATVYAPPHVSTTLCYYGDLRGIGSFDPDNRAGFGGALSIAGARTMEEVQAAIQARGIRYIVIPSWDPFFDEFASRYLLKRFANRSSFLVGELRAWRLPLWVRPVAYEMPAISGFERDAVRVFEVVDEQRPAVAASRLVEYLADAGLLDEAAALGEELRRYPGDCGALAARAVVLKARGDEAGFAQLVVQLRARLALNADRYLAWDRRVSLATVLAQANELDLARAQVRRCVDEVTDPRLRGLSTGGLYRLLVLSQAFEVPITNRPLHELAIGLLPAELRAKL